MRYVLFLLLIFPSISNAQYKEAILKDAQKIMTATIHLDYETLIRYTHPNLVQAAGGKEEMLMMIKEGMGELKSQKMSIDTVVFGQPGEIHEAGEELHTLLPENIVMSTPMGKLISKSTLLAVSNDKGISWVFLEVGSTLNNDNISDLLPNFNKKLNIPTNPKPVLYKQ